ncbi:uncharacterized protein BDW43DRAFT_73336 [Aspergillus alliaceus]|uniref:uncharacterized protein n=1 Tax=Petromyces alliaceus TaxID=209559 RepID=UPI0012A76C24|nr:uncharacterized protein BDW43DRAFT_73336 [Aspergillus alliaceus]KAB8239132.1 hypothetical protein BDW43DRAFT_73336 [Aspergillus alliaceus]
MPRTATIGSANIKIDLASPPGWTYVGGDTVIGNVVRRSHIVAPEATVTLALVGRVKTKISVKRNNGNGTSTSHYRGRWELFRPPRLVLFHGPLHLPRGSADDQLTWPFSLTVPERPTDEVLEGHCRAESFLPLDKDTLARSTLPASFYSSSSGWRTSSEGFVEYYLEAELRYGRAGSFEVEKATLPITMRHAPPAGLSFSYDLQSRGVEKRVKSQRLLPGMENAELTLKQKTQKLFGSSKVPEFSYIVEVSWPRAIQLDNPVPIPIIIGIKPSHTSSDIGGVVQSVRLNWVNMSIKSTTLVIAPGNFSQSNTHDDYHSSRHHFGLKGAFLNLPNPIVFTTGKENEPVDVGNMLGLVLHPNGATVGGRLVTTGMGIYPDFVTYNIHHCNVLDLEMSLTVAGKTHGVKVGSEVRILAAD